MTKGTELQREAEPVSRTPPASDVGEISVAEHAMLEDRGLRVRQAEQGGALPGGENGTAGHDFVSQGPLVFEVF
ncbi:MAG: hypothetical protein AAGF76_10690 [Pseudomonadota bacterium]